MALKSRTKVNQNDLRSLMKERRSNFTASVKRIESPLAKYNAIGQLSCVICNIIVKSETYWTEHISSKNHKENMLKKVKRKPAVPDSEDIKQYGKKQILSPEVLNSGKVGGQVSLNSAIIKSPINNAISSQIKVNHSNVDGTEKPIAKNSLLQEYLSSSDDEEEEDNSTIYVNQLKDTKVNDPALLKTTSVPPDFFDSPDTEFPKTVEISSATQSSQISSEKNKEIAAGSSSETLPEGFFDDPVLDAKARKVEYRDPMEEEYEKFKKVMAEESTVSQTITEEEEEKSQFTRDIEELDQQIQLWARIKVLEEKCEEMCKSHPVKTEQNEEDISTDSDLEESDIYKAPDWRYFKDL